MNKLNEDVLKTGNSQGKVLGKIGSGGGKNNELVGNGVEDKYKQDRQPLTLTPNLCKRNLFFAITNFSKHLGKTLLLHLNNLLTRIDALGVSCQQ